MLVDMLATGSGDLAAAPGAPEDASVAAVGLT
jgi:hypothetical protein